jgi:osmotically-inducible protein OsmY
MRNTIPLMLAFILLGAEALQGCASTAEQCTSDSCKQDAKITADLKAKLKEHRELGPPNSVYVQTRDGVVYLTGQVATDLQRSTAESLAENIPGVVSVVNSIALTFGGR